LLNARERSEHDYFGFDSCFGYRRYLLLVGFWKAAKMNMQLFVCGGFLGCVVIGLLLAIWALRGGSDYSPNFRRQRPRKGSPQLEAPDFWEENTPSPQLPPGRGLSIATQRANRIELAEAQRLWYATHNEPPVTIEFIPNPKALGPGEPSHWVFPIERETNFERGLISKNEP
jgi:hypothetical protein